MRRILFVLFAVACIPMDQVNKMIRDAQCGVLCVRSGYDAGKAGEKDCFCYDKMDFERTTEKRLMVPKQTKKHVPGPWNPIY